MHPGSLDVQLQTMHIAKPGIGMPPPSWIFIIVRKLDQQQVTLPNMLLYRQQPSLIQKGLAAAARHGMVFHGNTR